MKAVSFKAASQLHNFLGWWQPLGMSHPIVAALPMPREVATSTHGADPQ